MSTEENKALARRFIKTANEIKGNPDIVPLYINEFFAPEFICHISTGDMNRDQFEAFEKKIFTTFPNGIHTIEQLIAEDDMVVIQRTSQAGSQEFRAIDVCRIAAGKFIESWLVADIPPPE